MEQFPPKYFTFSARYPERTRVELGGGYDFTPRPSTPIRRQIILNVQGMTYFVKADGSMDLEREPGRNLALLEDFYFRHEIWKRFQLQHPAYGLLTVKFAAPLEVPEGIKGGNGTVNDFQVTLLEQV